MTQLAVLFGAGFASVFLLGFQSRNVNHGNYGWAFATSFLIAVAQVGVWNHIMRPGASWLQVGVYALAGAFGIVASMAAHQRFVARRGRP